MALALMKRPVVFCMLSFLSFGSAAAPELVGKWKSDRELSIAFIHDHVKLQPKTEKFIEDIMGRLTLTFTKTKLISLLSDFDVVIEGKTHRMEGFMSSSPYTVVYSSENVVAVSAVEPVTNKATVTIYSFVDQNTFWVYTGGSDKALPDSHYREYFRRVEG
ncbi:MAG: hypothetical protein IPL86_17170 [Flavobacteriales bacterium]|nr:hypothetical protein [Flavobacteriales bacterium]